MLAAMFALRLLSFVFGLAFLTASARSATLSTNEITALFGAWDGCFVMHDSQTGLQMRYNATNCAVRMSPCSTFKIPHTLLALETKVASGPDFPLPWDKVARSVPAWNRDHTLESAFQNSVVWYYQELARRIGGAREAEFLKKLGYGNMDITGGLTNFWLQSSLKISANEQIAFLQRLWAESLPASVESQRTVKTMMKLSDQDGRILYGKTGTGTDLGWFVGFLKRGDRVVTFATWISGAQATGKEARRISESIFGNIGL
jgi:beta-lactamase class D